MSKTFIIPMGGRGRRTAELGSFKPFIKINGKTILRRCLDSLPIKQDDVVVLITAKPLLSDDFQEYFLNLGREFESLATIYCVILPEVANGPAMTVYHGLKQLEHISLPGQVHVVNVDQEVEYEQKELSENDAAMPLWFNNKGASCYVVLDESLTKIIKIKEKQLISAYASSGVYIFGSMNLLLDAIESCLHDLKCRVNVNSKDYPEGELFIGPCINYVTTIGTVYPLTTYKKIDLGSTEAIKKLL